MATNAYGANRVNVTPISRREALRLVVANHYLHRKSTVSHCYGLEHDAKVVGVVIFGVPASRHLQLGACPTAPDSVIELNRLWVCDAMPRNTETWFLSRALGLLPPHIVVSYADTTQGHTGIIYRAANFNYAGWTDMDRAKPRLDYLTTGKHTRDAFRGGEGAASITVRRRPKVKYWITTGNIRERQMLAKICGWPKMSWKDFPPPTEHKRLVE
jgi:hypothetical protein